MGNSSKLFSLLILMLPLAVLAGESSNAGAVLAVGKMITAGNEGVCRIKVEGATFAESCPTAIYKEAYFLPEFKY